MPEEDIPVDTPFVGHLEPSRWKFLAVFEKSGVTRETPEDQRTMSLTKGEVKLRQSHFKNRGIACPNTDRALKYWPEQQAQNKPSDR